MDVGAPVAGPWGSKGWVGVWGGLAGGRARFWGRLVDVAVSGLGVGGGSAGGGVGGFFQHP
jgi:hypothetical protein